MTTRAPRPGEIDGVHYRFVDDATLRRDDRARASCSSGPSCTAAPATARRAAPVEEALGGGRLALLEIDLQGARQVRESMPEALFVFLAPPSWDELVRRLVGRGTETDEEREPTAGDGAPSSWRPSAEFDVTVVNSEVHDCGRGVGTLMRSDSGPCVSATAVPTSDSQSPRYPSPTVE